VVEADGGDESGNNLGLERRIFPKCGDYEG
jgi:hypothetical protein